ncbi:MAG: RimK family alpha-L-glutamate ligase [Chitinophagaceae bacterium]
MVVLYGLPEDPPIMKVYEQLLIDSADVLFLDQRNVQDYSFDLSVSARFSGEISYKGKLLINIKDVTGLYFRPYDFTQFEDFGTDITTDEQLKGATFFEYLLMTWAELFQGAIINRPSAMHSNHSKPFQAELIRQSDLLVPETLLTTDPKAVLEFHKRHGRIIYKSISSQRSIVAEFETEDLANVTSCITQFQQFINGTDYRIHVIGNKVFPAKIICEEKDYRYANNTEIEEAELPFDLQEKCIALTHHLGLNFSGIDLRRTENDDWFCFEVNPSPGYSYYQNYTGQPIAEAVAAFLLQ